MALKQSQLLPAELATQTADYARRTWHWKIPAKWKYEDLLNPETYKLVGDKLTPGDVITVIGELGDYDCDLRVVAADRGLLLGPRNSFMALERGGCAGRRRERGAGAVHSGTRLFGCSPKLARRLSRHLVEHEAKDALAAYLKDKAAAHAA